MERRWGQDAQTQRPVCPWRYYFTTEDFWLKNLVCLAEVVQCNATKSLFHHSGIRQWMRYGVSEILKVQALGYDPHSQQCCLHCCIYCCCGGLESRKTHCSLFIWYLCVLSRRRFKENRIYDELLFLMKLKTLNDKTEKAVSHKTQLIRLQGGIEDFDTWDTVYPDKSPGPHRTLAGFVKIWLLKPYPESGRLLCVSVCCSAFFAAPEAFVCLFVFIRRMFWSLVSNPGPTMSVCFKGL